MKHKSYIASIIIGVLLAVSCFSLFARSQAGVSRGAIEVARLYDLKSALARDDDSPRLVVIGGSSALFSVRSDVLQEETGLRSINFAVHAGLKIAYTLHRAKEVLRENDLALLALEYQQYDYDGLPNQLIADLVLGFDRSFLDRYSILDQLQFYLGVSMERRILTFFGLIEENESWEMTEGGDAAFNYKANRKPRHQRAVQKAQPTQALVKGLGSNRAWSELETFIAWCRERNIDIAVTFQPLLDRAEHRSTVAKQTFAQIRAFFSQHSISILSDPLEMIYPADDFFDTALHLTREAAEIHTHRIAVDLHTVLSNARGH